MISLRRGIAVLLIQVLLIAGVAGKYLYDRVTLPRVWVRAAQYDPNLPFRGRYLALSPEVNACNLPHDAESNKGWKEEHNGMVHSSWTWRVRVVARDGRLAVEDARDLLPRGNTQTIWLDEKTPCDRARLMPGVDFFIPDTAQSPLPLLKEPGRELWVEVSVPPTGPPRPIQLAISDNGAWKPLTFD